MELSSGTAKAGNPMVAERGEQRLQHAKRSTTKKWDLNAQDDFLAWSAELSRLIKRQLPPDFVKSSRPTEADYAMDFNIAMKTRQQVAACALRQREWDECNGGLFDIIIDSITVSPTEERHIETTYGGESPDGQQLLKYVLAHGDSSDEAHQIQLKAKLKALVIEPNASAKQIDAVWKDMNMLRDSIKSKRDEDAHDRIKIALKMIPKTHINFDYINPLIVVHDQGVLAPWTTFDAMVTKLMPVLRERDAENGTSASNQMALSIVEKRGDRRPPRNEKPNDKSGANMTANKCKHCDLRFCTSSGEWTKCVLHPSVKET